MTKESFWQSYVNETCEKNMKNFLLKHSSLLKFNLHFRLLKFFALLLNGHNFALSFTTFLSRQIPVPNEIFFILCSNFSLKNMHNVEKFFCKTQRKRIFIIITTLHCCRKKLFLIFISFPDCFYFVNNFLLMEKIKSITSIKKILIKINSRFLLLVIFVKSARNLLEEHSKI